MEEQRTTSPSRDPGFTAEFSRRDVLRALGAIVATGRSPKERERAAAQAAELPSRRLGRTGRAVVPLGLGGQASLQWTAPAVDAPDIVVRAVELGVNYLDTANAYGPSQSNYGAAFRRLGLVPGEAGYNAALRERLYLATKTGQRFAVVPGAGAQTAVDDLKRSLTQLFGDGRGAIPEGAYLDAIQIHNLSSAQQVDQIYEGLEGREAVRPDQRLGALAGLLDYRDGTNVTGLNPGLHRYVRHIGVTGHQSSPVLMYALQRDSLEILDTVLVALNANDRRYSSHQYNVVPLAQARDMGVIAMKAFADGVFYGKAARFSTTAADVVRSVGGAGGVDPALLVRYPISLPGVATVITGIGQVNRQDPARDQLVANLAAAVDTPASETGRRWIEDWVAQYHGTDTNYFQERQPGPVPPRGVQLVRDGARVIVSWQGALAGPEPLRWYRIYAGDTLLASQAFRPQLTVEPLSVVLEGMDDQALASGRIRVVAE